MVRRRVSVTVALTLWVLLVAVTWTVLARAEGGPGAELARWLGVLMRPGVGVPVLLLAFAIRPLLLIPVTLLTAFAGWWLGLWLGFAVAWVAVTASAAVPYVLARTLRGPPRAGPVGTGWRGALARDPFRSVLVARLMMLPGDLVSAAAGAVRVPWGSFLAATALGGVPGLVVGVLAGAALDDTDAFTWSAVDIDTGTVVAAAVASAMALGLAWALRRRSRTVPPTVER